MTMLEKIDKVIDERYLVGDHIALYDKDGIHLAEVIEPMLEEEETISQYSINYAEMYSVYYFSIAYIENGKLEHFTYEIEVC